MISASYMHVFSPRESDLFKLKKDITKFEIRMKTVEVND